MSLGPEQNVVSLGNKLCSHSRVASFIIRDFDNPYYLENWLSLTDDVDESGHKIEILLRKRDKSTKSQHLAVAFFPDKHSILWTQGKQTTPRCSSCSSPCCHCVRAWRKKLDSESSTMQDKQDDQDENFDHEAHYNDGPKLGFNRSKIRLPLTACPIQNEAFINRNENFSLPEELVPIFDERWVVKNKLRNHVYSGFIVEEAQIQIDLLETIQSEPPNYIHPPILTNLGIRNYVYSRGGTDSNQNLNLLTIYILKYQLLALFLTTP